MVLAYSTGATARTKFYKMLKAIKKFFSESVPVNEQAVIAEIHNEFDTAGERLLKEAKEILAIPSDSVKGDRLKKLGFVNSEAAVKSQELEKQKAEKRELAKVIEYFQTFYPNYKFITEEIVKQICEKYGLLCGDVSYYKGDVPEKNIAEIEGFKLRDEDKKKRLGLNPSQVYEQYLKLAQSRAMDRMSGLDGSFAFDLGFLRNSLSGIAQSRPKYESGIETFGSQQKVSETLVQPPFKICAPENDFDTRYLTRSGHKLELHIPDPIVLQPVNGGYLIVSKWGLEATDELVQNEKMN